MPTNTIRIANPSAMPTRMLCASATNPCASSNPSMVGEATTGAIASVTASAIPTLTCTGIAVCESTGAVAIMARMRVSGQNTDPYQWLSCAVSNAIKVAVPGRLPGALRSTDGPGDGLEQAPHVIDEERQ